jgi:hypothetical protein
MNMRCRTHRTRPTRRTPCPHKGGEVRCPGTVQPRDLIRALRRGKRSGNFVLTPGGATEWYRARSAVSWGDDRAVQSAGQGGSVVAPFSLVAPSSSSRRNNDKRKGTIWPPSSSDAHPGCASGILQQRRGRSRGVWGWQQLNSVPPPRVALGQRRRSFFFQQKKVGRCKLATRAKGWKEMETSQAQRQYERRHFLCTYTCNQAFASAMHMSKTNKNWKRYTEYCSTSTSPLSCYC